MKQKDPSSAPQVFAVKRQGVLWTKRTFLKGAVATAAAAATACSGDDDENGSPFQPFSSGGVSYQVVALPDYNAVLPESGNNLTIVAFVQNDFYFRSFDAAGQIVVNQHESKVSDKAALTELKTLTHGVIARGRMEPAEQARFAELATTAARGTATGRRMQGTATPSESQGRRMQGSTSTGQLSGRRMQGAEGRAEAGTAPRNLGRLTINGQQYEHTRIIAAYTDGYSTIAHAGGEVTVRTDALPQIVQMQLPVAVPNPSPRPSAIPHTTVTTTPAPAPVPAPAPAPSVPRSTGHYWRPN